MRGFESLALRQIKKSTKGDGALFAFKKIVCFRKKFENYYSLLLVDNKLDFIKNIFLKKILNFCWENFFNII